jgi:hypothetical protein
MGNIHQTSANTSDLNLASRRDNRIKTGDIIDSKVTGSVDGMILISGGFLTAGDKVTPTTTYGSNFTVAAEGTTSGCYKLTLDTTYGGYDMVGITGSIGVGVAYNGGNPDCSGAGAQAYLDAVCINMKASGEAPEIWIRIVGDDDGVPMNVDNALVTFMIVVKA